MKNYLLQMVGTGNQQTFSSNIETVLNPSEKAICEVEIHLDNI